ncbi:hypothetical protein B0H13DRAFT_2338089 [Mycena leptocephala]|nr:hypothetical protein B0H13DRAFT_2343846 [Mycena leptocephala]KAJ7896892.1 hypothetical protein B0H13DRAFT_2338089 [Mycena leptocephala]
MVPPSCGLLASPFQRVILRWGSASLALRAQGHGLERVDEIDVRQNEGSFGVSS